MSAQGPISQPALRAPADGPARGTAAPTSTAERSDEHAEVISRTEPFLTEIAMERGRGRATYTEVEKSAADLRRAQTWLASIRARDYFDADGYQDAAAVERCEEALAAFEREALANELAEPHGALEDKPRRLRAVAPEDDAVTETRRLSALPHPARMDECSERTVRRGGPAGTQGGQRLEKAAMVCVHSPYIRRGENK